MKIKPILFLLCFACAFPSMRPAWAQVPAKGAGHLTVVLDNSKEMRSLEAVDKAISYINTLMQGFEKDSPPPKLAVTVYQICAETPWLSDTRFHSYSATCRVGDGRQFYPDKKSRAEYESPITFPATKKEARNKIFDWAGKGNGIILISSAPEAKALNLGGGYHDVILPARDAKEHLEEDKFTTAIHNAFDRFLEKQKDESVVKSAVKTLKASATKVYAFEPVSFEIELDGSETATADFGDGGTADYRIGGTLKHAYRKAGRYTVAVRPSGGGAGKSVAVSVSDAEVSGLSVRPVQLTTADTAEVAFQLRGAPSAAVDFGDGTKPVFAKPDGGRVTLKHRYGTPGSYTLQAIPRNGANAFPPATIAVVVGDEPHRLGLSLAASKTKTVLPDGSISFTAALENAVRAEIDFGDGSPAEKAKTAPMPHDYAKAGTYTVKLTAWAADGSTGSRTCSVQIAEPVLPPPSCRFEPESPRTALGATLEVKCRFQNAESAAARFSDGGEADVAIGADGTATIRHEFRAAGTQNVIVTMKGNGKTAEARCQVSVDKADESFGMIALYVSRDGEDVPLENDGAGHYWGAKAGEEITLKAEKARNAAFTVNYGDESDPEHGATTSHAYQEGGEYTIEINAKGTSTKASLGKKSVTVKVKGGSPLPGVLAVLAVLAAAFGVGKAVAQGKRKLVVTGPDGKETKRKAGRLRLDPGVEIQVSVGKGGTLSVSLAKGSASAEGRSLTEEAAKFGRRVEIRTVGGTWTIEAA